MKHITILLVGAMLGCLAPAAFAGRIADEILEQVVPEPGLPGDDSMRVRLTSSTIALTVAPSTTTQTVDPLAWTVMRLSTGAVDNTAAVLAVPASSTRVGTILTNECADDIRFGNSGITADVGQLLKAGGSVTLDLPRYFRGALYVRGTTGSSCKYSAMEALP